MATALDLLKSEKKKQTALDLVQRVEPEQPLRGQLQFPRGTPKDIRPTAKEPELRRPPIYPYQEPDFSGLNFAGMGGSMSEEELGLYDVTDGTPLPAASEPRLDGRPAADPTQLLPPEEVDNRIGILELIKRATPLDIAGKLPIPLNPFREGMQTFYELAKRRLKTLPGDYKAEDQWIASPYGMQMMTPAYDRKSDEKFVKKYEQKKKEEARRGFTTGAYIASGLAETISWAADITFLGPTRQAVALPIKAVIKSKSLGKALSILAGAAITAGSQSPRLMEEINRRQAQDPTMSLEKVVGKAATKLFIANLSEMLGEYITAGGIKILRKLPFSKKLFAKVAPYWRKMTGASAAEYARKISTATGINSIFGEVGEQRVETFLDAILKLDDFGAGKDAGPLERVYAGWKQDVSNFGIEIAVLTLPVTGRYVAASILAAKAQRQQPTPEMPVTEPTKEAGLPGVEGVPAPTVKPSIAPVKPKPARVAPKAEIAKQKPAQPPAEKAKTRGISFVGRAGTTPRFPNSYEWRKAVAIQNKLGKEANLEIYDQADTGSLYGNIKFPDGRIYPIRIATHPTKTTLHVVEKAKREAKIPAAQPSAEAPPVVEPLAKTEAKPGEKAGKVEARTGGFPLVLSLTKKTPKSKEIKPQSRTVEVGKRTGLGIPEKIKLTQKNRKLLIADTRKKIRDQPLYQDYEQEIRRRTPQLSRKYLVSEENYRGEVARRGPEIRRFFTTEKLWRKNNPGRSLPLEWDKALTEMADMNVAIEPAGDIDYFLDVMERVISETKYDRGKINQTALELARNEPLVNLLAEKLELLQQGKNKAQINKALRDQAKYLGVDPAIVTGRLELPEGVKADIVVEPKIKTKTVKEQIREAISGPEPKPIVSAADALKYAMKHEAKGSMAGYRAGQLDLQASQKDIISFAKEHLPITERGKILPAIPRARTEKQRYWLIKAINRIQNNYEKRRALAEFKKARVSLDLRHLRPEYRTKAEKLLSAISEHEPLAKTVTRMEALKKYLDVTEDPAVPNLLLQRMREVLAVKGKISLRRLEPDEIELLTKAIQNIVHLNKLKNQLIFTRKSEDARKVIAEAVSEVVNRHQQKKAYKAGEYAIARRQPYLGRLASWDQLSMDTKAFILGGDEGAVYDLLFNGPRKGQREAVKLRTEWMNEVQNILKKHGLDYDGLKKWSAPFTLDVRKGKTEAEIISVEVPSAISETGKLVKSIELTRAERMDISEH
ncbi:MAG: hypothetical protein JRI34_04640, partial [Deltaproteobacteria bacterium]|nr:hypothetical protein [Deltaproteobacteria bacterium]